MREILLLCEYATLNGGERSMLATFDGLGAAGFTPTVMAPPDGPLANELARRGIEVLPFRCRNGDERIPLAQLREELAAILHSRRPSVLHANSLAMGRLSGPVAADLRVPSLSHLRDIIKLSAQAVADLNRHQRLLAVSAATRDFHIAHGLLPEKTHVLHNGVDLDVFCPRPSTGYLHRELGLPPDTQLIGTVGQIGLRKGQEILLEAAMMLHDPNADAAHYLIVGERNSDKAESRRFEEGLHAMATGSLSGRVHFLGRRNDVPLLLNELTLLVHTARQEPLGRVLLESAAAGVPIIATAVGGTAEIFPPEGHSALLIPPNDAAALAAAMSRLLDDAPLRHCLAAAARQGAEDHFDIRQAVAGLIGHYDSVLSHSAGCD
ncbi:MAG: glycosyltransferase family 4 protein [Planctomycetaceae bacterium]|nr:glycosyltransferase family 4 protein [Planctomycetaceae bacterium]